MQVYNRKVMEILILFKREKVLILILFIINFIIHITGHILA